MLDMEKSEPALAPEWLRSNGGGNGGGSLSHHFASSQADGPVLALPRRSRSSKSIGNSDSLHSPLLDRSSSSNSRRSLNSNNGFNKNDKNSYARSYSSFSRSHRDRDRERSTIADSWDSEYSDPLRGMISGRGEDPLRRSQSLISRRPVEAPQRMISDMRNGIHKNLDNGNGTQSVGGNVTGVQKVSFEKDFPVLGFEDRPKTPDIIRVSSPGLSRGIHSLAFGNPPSVGSEAWRSALAEVPSASGSNNDAGSLPALQPVSTVSASSPNPVSVSSSTLSGLNMAEALVQAPAQAHKTPQPSAQLQRDELALAQSKKLIPMIPVLPKTMVLSSSDKLKPKTAMRSSDTAVTPKNGLHHPSPLQLGSQPVRGVSVRGDGPKSPSSGKLLVLKSGRENGILPGLKDLQSPTANINNRVANGQSIGPSSAASGPSKNSHSPKMLAGDRKTFGYGLNPGAGVGTRNSRSDFFKLMREKSLNNSSPTDSGASASSDVVDKTVKEAKDQGSAQATPAETGSELNCSGNTCTVADSFSPSMKIDNEEERAFLLSLGWDDNGEDEEGLTEEEIYAFYNDVMKQGPTSRLCRVLQAKVFSNVGCSSPNEPNSPASQAEA